MNVLKLEEPAYGAVCHPSCRGPDGVMCEVWRGEEDLWGFCVVSGRNQDEPSKVNAPLWVSDQENDLEH